MYIHMVLLGCRDDLHMWLAPFMKRTNHFIYLTFQQKCAVAMIRIWVRPYNYRISSDPIIISIHSPVTELQQISYSLTPRCQACPDVLGWGNHFQWRNSQVCTYVRTSSKCILCSLHTSGYMHPCILTACRGAHTLEFAHTTHIHTHIMCMYRYIQYVP